MVKYVGSGIATVLLLIGVVFWGASFVFVKQAVAVSDVYSFLTLRFSAAAFIMLLVCAGRLRRYNASIFKLGMLIGVELGASFICQTLGIHYTSASNAAFITGLCVVIVPLIVVALDRRAPSPAQIAAVAIAVVGLVLLTFKTPFSVGRGDYILLACAFGFAVHIVLISRLVHGIDTLMFTATQFFAVACLSAAMAFAVNGRIVVSSEPALWRGVAFCSIFASAYIYTAQAKFQKYMSEIKATMVYSLEPLFAAVFAFFMIGERLTPAAMAGGGLIFAAMLLADVKPGPKGQGGKAEKATIEGGIAEHRMLK